MRLIRASDRGQRSEFVPSPALKATMNKRKANVTNIFIPGQKRFFRNWSVPKIWDTAKKRKRYLFRLHCQIEIIRLYQSDYTAVSGHRPSTFGVSWAGNCTIRKKDEIQLSALLLESWVFQVFHPWNFCRFEGANNPKVMIENWNFMVVNRQIGHEVTTDEELLVKILLQRAPENCRLTSWSVRKRDCYGENPFLWFEINPWLWAATAITTSYRSAWTARKWSATLFDSSNVQTWIQMFKTCPIDVFAWIFLRICYGANRRRKRKTPSRQGDNW